MGPAIAQESTETNAAAVTLSGESLFEIKANIGSFTPQDRAQAVSRRLLNFAKNASVPVTALKIDEQNNQTSIKAGGRTIFSVVKADADNSDESRQELAAGYLRQMQAAVQGYRDSRSLKSLIFSAIYAFLATVALLVLFRVMGQVATRVLQTLDSGGGTRIPSLRVQNIELLPATQITDILIRIFNFLRSALYFALFYLYTLLILSLFPWTKPIGASLSLYLLQVIENLFQGLLSYLPNLFVIGLVIGLTYYILRFIWFIFEGIDRGRFSLPGFYAEWAKPTDKLVTFLVIAFACVVVFPYLPGAKSPAFQGVSVFLGLLLSLGSSAAISNVIAGVILIYTRAFEVGDRVKVGDAVGDIVEKTLLVTRIRSVKNVVITIPNASVLNAQIINYSAADQDSGTPPLILHTTITLGYDVPWRKVHETLISAARSTPNILAEPSPFVLQTSLDDFYVSYELNAYTDKPLIMAKVYSELHQNIQDKCNEGGIEILSPHYRAVRDGNQNTIPESYLPPDYVPPGFRLEQLPHSPDAE